MYGITNESSYTPENFFAGDFPISKDFGAVANGVTVRRHAPVVLAADGTTYQEAAADTLDSLVGIAADDSSGDEVTYYLTGEFFTESVILPAGVTAEALKPAFRKLGIFLKEMNSNG